MLNAKNIADVIFTLPQAREVSVERSYWNDTVGKLLPLVLDEIAVAHDFDFVLKAYSDVTTVADQEEYVIEGDDKDCRDIVSIRYGDDQVLLTKYRTLDMDDIVSNNQSPSTTAAWDQYRRNPRGFPIIRLVAVPGSAGTALHIRYRRNNVVTGDFPNEFGHVVALGVVAWVNPILRRPFERQLKKIIKNHRRGGKDVQIVSINPHMVQTQNKVSGLYRTG